jgi:hypothetical protein
MDLGRRPFEWTGGLVIGFDEIVDVGLEFAKGVEGCALERLAGEDGEPDLDLIEPGGAGWREMEMHVRMALQPAIVLWLVCIEIVEDDVNFAPLMLSDDPVHEVEKFDAPSPLVLAAGHLACGDVEGGEQGRRPVSARPFGIFR